MTSTWYPRFMRALGWSLLALSILVLAGGVFVAIGHYNEYGWDGWGEAISQGWWILVVAAVPAMASWLVFRIASDRAEKPSSGRQP